MDAELQRYINDHLAGASGAIDLIRSLVETSEESEETHFFRELEIKVERDRDLLKGLLEKMGRSSSTFLEIAGNLSGKAGRLKLMWEGLKPGELGRFEAMEMLAIGIQGKRLLWVMLGELAPWIPEWEGIVFSDLELDAISQRDAVEARRIESGLDGLLDVERGARKGRIQSRMETL